MKAIRIIFVFLFLITLTACNQKDNRLYCSQNDNSSLDANWEYGITSTASLGSNADNSKSNESVVLSPDNWYIDGYEIPDNWLPIMISTEAFEHFDEILSQAQAGQAIDVTIQNLMNRNVIAFEILYGREPAYMLTDSTNSSFCTQNTSNICPIHSDYFDSLEDVVEIMNGTYTKALSEERLNGSAGDRKLFLEKDDALCVDFDSMYYWSSDPFKSKTYIEILDSNESTCRFNWHYIEWGQWDYEGNDTDKFYPHHRQKICKAVVEEGKWKLTNIIFDNELMEE